MELDRPMAGTADMVHGGERKRMSSSITMLGITWNPMSRPV